MLTVHPCNIYLLSSAGGPSIVKAGMGKLISKRSKKSAAFIVFFPV